MINKGELKCHRCPECNGQGCPDMLPGLGGVMGGSNFQANFKAWKQLYEDAGNLEKEKINSIKITPSSVRCGPVTGSQENIGYFNEKDFYYPYLKNAKDSGFGLCVGDGCPDYKLEFGTEAVKNLNAKAAFFLKPYPQEVLKKRVQLVKPYASFIGIDIDSYNIVTMRNLVNLERKTKEQLEEFRNFSGLPFVIKGVFTKEDLELVKEVKPDVVYISNHGGRVETRKGSTGLFLKENGAELKKYCSEIWIDGGLRCLKDLQTAVFYGASQVILARPFIKATFDENYPEMVKKLFNSFN